LAYAELSAIQHRLGLVDTTSTDDEVLQQALDWATGFIENYTGRIFTDPSGTAHYFSRQSLAFGDVRVLEVDDDLLSVSLLKNGDGTTITSDQYVLEPRNAPYDVPPQPYHAIRVLSTMGAFWVWPVDGYVQVFGQWGYSQNPDDLIIGACLRLAEWYYRSKAPLTTTTLFDGSIQREKPEGFPSEVLVELDQRKRLA